jgi:hypothetical protein
MPDTQRAGQPLVFRLAGAATQSDQEFAAALDRAGARLARADNVYDALVDLLRSDPREKPELLIACADLIDDAETEFFSILARELPSLAIHIYSQDRSSARVQRMVERFGVTCIRPEQVAQLVAGRPYQPLPSVAAPPAPAETESEPPAASSLPEDRKTPIRQPPKASPSEAPDQSHGGLLSSDELAALLAPDESTTDSEGDR